MMDLIGRLESYSYTGADGIKRQLADDFAEAVRELHRLQRIEAAALRVASSRRDGIVTDQGPLDLLDAALEQR